LLFRQGCERAKGNCVSLPRFSLPDLYIVQAVESGQGPDIEGTESPLRLSYLTLVVLGSTRISGKVGTDSLQHAATLEYLISVGAPLDLGDIVGYSPLFHSMIGTPNLALARILLEAGASANHRNKYGESPLLPVMMQGHPESLDLLMEFDANLDTADSDGIVPRHFAVKAGPQFVAIVGKWERKRAGITDAPLESSQRCKTCGKSKADGVSLNLCASCKLVKYCSKDCQSTSWTPHMSFSNFHLLVLSIFRHFTYRRGYTDLHAR
jgi:hypothetical protein